MDIGKPVRTIEVEPAEHPFELPTVPDEDPLPEPKKQPAKPVPAKT